MVKAKESLPTLLLRSLAHRSRLLALEAGQAGGELITCVITGAAVVFFVLGALIGLHVLLLLAVWESEHRTLYAGLCVTVEAGTALALFLHLRKRMRRWRPFVFSREEWQKDALWIEELMSDSSK